MADSSRDNNRQILARTLVGSARGALTRRSQLRYHVLRELWSTTKRFGAPGIEDIEIREVPAVQEAVIESYIDDRNRGVLAALCRGLGVRECLEIGTNRGRTAWTIARNNPQTTVYTLDLPARDALDEVKLDLNESDRDFFVSEWDRGVAFAGTPEAERIKPLYGDSATFDFSPYEGRMDLVFIDGAHTYSYIKNDTEAALGMLSPTGTLVWDDYPAIPGVYRYLTDLALSIEQPMFHILGTRLVVSSRQEFVKRLTDEERIRLEAA